MLRHPYHWAYTAGAAGFSAYALAIGTRNCAAKNWGINHILPAHAILLGAGAACLLFWKQVQKKDSPPVPLGEWLLFSVVVSLTFAFGLLAALMVMHQDCC